MLGTSCVHGQSYSWSSSLGWCARTHKFTHAHTEPAMSCLMKTVWTSRPVMWSSVYESIIDIRSKAHCDSINTFSAALSRLQETHVCSVCVWKRTTVSTTVSLVMSHPVKLIIVHKWTEKIGSVWCYAGWIMFFFMWFWAVCMKVMNCDGWVMDKI